MFSRQIAQKNFSNHRTELEQAIYDETYNWTIVEWRAFRGQFSNYYEIRNQFNNYYIYKEDLIGKNRNQKWCFDQWKLEQIIDFKARNFDLRKEGTNG
jgi:hypothetical protein